MRRHLPTKVLRPYLSLPFFEQLPRREQELLLRMGTELMVPPGSLVASSSGGGRQCTLLLTGAWTWSEPAISGGMEPIRKLDGGDFLDEEVLTLACSTEEGPGAFWVHSCIESRVIVFHRSEFNALVDLAPSVRSLAAWCTAVHLSSWEPRAAFAPLPSEGESDGDGMVRQWARSVAKERPWSHLLRSVRPSATRASARNPATQPW